MMAVPAWAIGLALQGWQSFTRWRRNRKMTDGMKSSEFYMTIATFLASLLAKKLGGELPIEAVAGVIAYIISRGLAKWTSR